MSATQPAITSAGIPATTSEKMTALRRAFRRRAEGGLVIGGRSAPDGRLSLDPVYRVPQPGQRLGVHRVRLQVRAQPFHHVGDQAQEDRRIGQEELRLVVV